MLTPDIIIYAPGFISPTREPWTGTIAEHFTQAGDRAWDKLAAILADHAIDDGGWDYMDNGGVYFTPGVDTAESLAAALLDVAEEATRIARKASNRGIDD